MARDEVRSQSTSEVWMPIDGVTVEQYAELTGAMMSAGVVGPDAIEDWLAGRGIDPGAWPRITAGWSRRMVRDREVRERFEDAASER